MKLWITHAFIGLVSYFVYLSTRQCSVLFWFVSANTFKNSYLTTAIILSPAYQLLSLFQELWLHFETYETPKTYSLKYIILLFSIQLPRLTSFDQTVY